jgi:hypothetical protein
MKELKKMLFNTRSIFFILLILLVPRSEAQEYDQFQENIKEALKSKPKLDARVDLRNSFITTRLAQIRGVKLGLDYESTVKFGLSYNWLESNITRQFDDADGSYDAELKYRYIAPYFEYAFYRRDPWEISIPAHLGLGLANYEYNTVSGRVQQPYQFILSYEPYMVGRYIVFKYFGIGAGVGYRLVLVGNNALQENFNSPIYVFKFQVLLGRIWSDLKKTNN